MKKYLGVVFALITAAVMTTGCGSGSGSVATVGGEKITTAEYNFFLSQAKSQVLSLMGVDSSSAASFDWKTKIQNQTAEEFTKQLALDNATEFKIALMKAKDSNMSLSKTEEDTLIKNINEQVVSQMGTKKLDQEKNMKAQWGVSISDFKSIYKEYAQSQKFANDWKSKLKYTDDDVKKYYEDNKDQFQTATVRHILFTTVDANRKPLSADKVAAAEKNANDMLAKVQAGEDMTALAEKFSEDPGVKENKGEYSFYKSGQTADNQNSLVKEFPDFAFSHKVGDVGIVKTDYGFHVIKLEKLSTYEDVKDNVSGGYVNKKYADEMEKWKKDAKYKLVKDQSALDKIKM